MSDLTVKLKSHFDDKASHQELMAAQKRRQAESGIAPKPGGHLTAPAGFQSHANEPAAWADYTNYGYPIFDKAHADDAASRWGDAHNEERYDEKERGLIAHRIETAQARFGESDGKTHTGLTTKGAISVAGELAEAELWEKLYDLWWAFCCAYSELDEREDEDGGESSSDQFNALVDEYAALLKSAFADTETKGLGDEITRLFADAKDAFYSAKGIDSMTTKVTQGELNTEVTPDESKDAVKTATETATPAPEAKETALEAIVTKMAEQIEALTAAVAKTIAPAVEPVTETAEELSKKELDALTADVTRVKGELADMEKKTSEAQARYEAVLQKELPVPSATTQSVDLSKMALTSPLGSTDSPEEPGFAGKSSEDFLR